MELLLVFLLLVTTGELTPIKSVNHSEYYLKDSFNISTALQRLAVAYRATSPDPAAW